MERYISTNKLMNNMVTFVSPKLAQSIIKAVDETPTEELTPIVRGKWITVPIEPYSIRTRTYCSVCKHGQQQKGYKKYCGYCGAKMKESEKE